jgi:hypothetical protein
MALPLSPQTTSRLNMSPSRTTSASSFHTASADYGRSIDQAVTEDYGDGPPSSPFSENVTRDYHGKSPLKVHSPRKQLSPSKSINKSPSKVLSKSPTKLHSTQAAKTWQEESPYLDSLRDNEGLTKAFNLSDGDVFDNTQVGDDTFASIKPTHESNHTSGPFQGAQSIGGYSEMDDTMFSTFSAVQNVDMTLFAGGKSDDDTFGGSPAKQLLMESARYQDNVSVFSF